MSHVLFLAENFFNVSQFPRHVVSGGAQPDSFRAGTSRRSTQNKFTFSPANTGGALRVACDRVRTADTLIIDRNNDLTGTAGVSLSASLDRTLGQIFINVNNNDPSNVVVEGSNVDDLPHWIRTEEGAQILHFPETEGIEWDLTFDAGAGTFVGGVYLGKSYRPTFPRLPFDEAGSWEAFGTVRRGVPDNDIRTGKAASVSLMMRDEQEWTTARWTLRQLFGKGHPMWFIHAPNTERAWLSYNVGGAVSAPFSERPQGRTVVVGLEEYDPALP